MAKTEADKIAQLHPLLRELAPEILQTIRELLSTHEGLEDHKVVLVETFRPHEKQWDWFRKGRVFKNKRWVITDRKKVVTFARPQESAHCHQDKDGNPAALAMDIAIIGPEAWLRDGHPAWSLVPAAAYIEGGDLLEMGAAFRRIPGGDWPHLQARGWRQVARSE